VLDEVPVVVEDATVERDSDRRGAPLDPELLGICSSARA
jgi:hypothetical protein